MGYIEELGYKLRNGLDIPQNGKVKGVTLEVRNFREVYIQGCSRLLEYSPALIDVQCISGKVMIVGRDMKINVFSGDVMVVYGKIDSVTRGVEGNAQNFE